MSAIEQARQVLDSCHNCARGLPIPCSCEVERLRRALADLLEVVGRLDMPNCYCWDE